MAKKIFYDKIKLGFGQSLMIGHRPEKLLLSNMAKSKPELGIASFGLFESATPTFSTYYPDVTAEDLKPKDGDFVKPIFRALSEVIVRKKTQPLDFGMNGVLKASMQKLLGQTIFANHEAIIGNHIGSVSQVSWQESYTTSTGIKVPAGINAEFKIDAKSHPNIARAIMMEPPAIHSNSVTVEFGWEQSHPSMDRPEFFGKMGSFGSDGKLIRRIATEIRNYHETSLVAHGADPFAQRVGKDGKINNAEYADSVYSLSMQGKEEPKVYFFSYKEDTTSLEEENSIPDELNHINTEEQTMKKEFITAMALKYKVAETEITEQFLQDKLTAAETSAATLITVQAELATEKGTVTKLTGELAAEKTTVTNLTTEKDSFKTLADAAQAELLTETKRVYTALKGDKADAAKLALLDKADAAALRVELKAFNDEMELKFPATCKKCGSSEVARNTASVAAPGTAEAEAKKTGAEKTDAELNAEFRKESKPGYIFDKK